MEWGRGLISFICHVDIQLSHLAMFILSPLNVLGTPVENQMAIDVKIYLWTLSSIDLVDISIFFFFFLPVPHCFDYSSFVISSEVGRFESFYFVFLSQCCFQCSGPLVVPYDFENWLFFFCKIDDWYFVSDFIASVNSFESSTILK